ncbi:MAG: 1-deoxy-D-xylulose-5-phosphate synthase [Candidatus Anoxychlamydiales bacterium]|nr:1-deoxy-D-xylulose-5-phosphate synthase [Candidatus Anoxychlamydiales bacterium]
MRNAFADELTKLASLDQRIVLLSGDIGNRLFDNFKKLFPNRFYNCGVAEANMTSVAAGMAMCGLKPITYTITPFNTTRCLEQIKLDVCYHNQSVIIVGVGAGLSYASLGGSHHSCEDISFLRSIPNMTVTCPADAFEVRKILKEAINLGGPVYIRIGKKGEPQIHQNTPDITIGKGYIIQKGKDLCLISTGNMLFETIKTAKILKTYNLDAHIVNMHTIKPLDKDLLKEVFSKFSLVASIEEHSLIGGLGSSIAEWMVDNHISTKFLRFGTKDEFFHKLGSQQYLRDYNLLNSQEISKTILKTLKKEKL